MSAKDYFKEFTKFTDEEFQQADAEVAILTLINGVTPIGDDFWAYILVPPSKYVDLYETEDFTDKPMDEFGEVIEWGIGKEPPEGVRQFIEMKYNANHNLQQEVIEKAKDIENRMRITSKVIRKILDE